MYDKHNKKRFAAKRWARHEPCDLGAVMLSILNF